MTYRLQYTKQARGHIERLYQFFAGHDLAAARNALAAIDRAATMLVEFPFANRKADADNPFLRELIIPFGNAAGYVALFEIENEHTITVLAVRHQREDDYH